MRGLHLLFIAVVALAGCQHDPAGGRDTDPSAGAGTLEGTVVAGRGIETEIAGARVALYSSADSLAKGRPLPQRASLVGTLPRYTFVIGGLQPGRYFIEICSTQAGCVYPGTRITPSPTSVSGGVNRVTIALNAADFPA